MEDRVLGKKGALPLLLERKKEGNTPLAGVGPRVKGGEHLHKEPPGERIDGNLKMRDDIGKRGEPRHIELRRGICTTRLKAMLQIQLLGAAKLKGGGP